MKKTKLIFLTAFVSSCFWSFGSRCQDISYQREVKKPQSEITETQCLKRADDFLKWYTSFSNTDDSLRHVLKLVKSHGVESYRIDTVGAEDEVNRCYQSGFFTESWKRNTLRNILAADTALSQLKTDDWDLIGENVFVIGVIGDPVLGYANHEELFEPGYRWQVKGFKVLRKGVCSIDLFYHTGSGPANKSVIQFVLRNGHLQIEKVSYPVAVDGE